METTIPTLPADLAELKTRLDIWRANKKQHNEPLPAELRQAVLNLSHHYSTALVHRILRLNPSRLSQSSKTTSATKARRKKPQSAFFKLPPVTAMPAPQSTTHCRIQLERPDGSRLTLTIPSLDANMLNSLCCDFLRSK
jgi:hypothetical protein